MLQRLSSLIQQRQDSWRILLLTLCALILAVVPFSRMLLLSVLVGVTPQETFSQSQIWARYILNALFGLGFIASAYGLSVRRNWGRLLFIGMMSVWAGFYLLALFTSTTLSSNRDFSALELAINLILNILGPIAAIWYLNLSYIKALFDTHQRKSANTLPDTDE